MNISNEHLRSWHDLREEGGLLAQISYVQILNALIEEHGVKIKEDCTRIDGLLYKAVAMSKANAGSSKGVLEQSI